MNFKERLTAIGDGVKIAAKEIVYRAVNPKIEFYVDEDGYLCGRGMGIRGHCMQGLINHYCDRIKNLRVITTLNGSNVYSLYHPPFPSIAGERGVQARIRDAVFNLRTPTTNTMAITYKCQCNCVHCSADAKVDPTRQELTTEEWKQVIDDSVKIGIYNHVITGGEPCVRKDLPEIIAHVTPEKGTVLMFTNGILLKKRAKELADAGLYAVNISIDDFDPQVHNSLRRFDKCYEMAFEGGAALREYGILTGISTYATKEKIKDGSLEELIEKAGKEGFLEVTIFDPMPSGKWMRDTSFVLNEEEREYLRKLTLDSRERTDSPAVIAQSYINSPHGSGCFGGYYQVYTTAYGDVNPCDFNPVSFGNVREEGLLKSWYRMIHHPEYRNRRLHCRMQNPEYRRQFIDTVPDGSIWPIPVDFYNGKSKVKRVKDVEESVEQKRQIHQH